LPQSREPASDPALPIAPPINEPIWLEPIPDEMTAGIDSSPEARYETRESISLAFLAALQFLPARQRAVLVLRDVLDMSASQVADVLGTSVPSVNSILHRARAALDERAVARRRESMKALPPDRTLRELLSRYVRAWESADVDALVNLLKQDATFPMPPMPGWYQGKDAIAAFLANTVLTRDTLGQYRLLETRANGQPAFAFYKLDDSGGVFRPFSIQVVTFDGDLIQNITTFATPSLFKYFGFPQELAR
jgi:RNA polymerase sigma-70 factor (ECF subfamily)